WSKKGTPLLYSSQHTSNNTGCSAYKSMDLLQTCPHTIFRIRNPVALPPDWVSFERLQMTLSFGRLPQCPRRKISYRHLVPRSINCCCPSIDMLDRRRQ